MHYSSYNIPTYKVQRSILIKKGFWALLRYKIREGIQIVITYRKKWYSGWNRVFLFISQRAATFNRMSSLDSRPLIEGLLDKRNSLDESKSRSQTKTIKQKNTSINEVPFIQ